MKKLLMATLVLIMGLGMAAKAVSIEKIIYCDKDHGEGDDEHENHDDGHDGDDDHDEE